jgi:hypothetical protein
MCEQVRVELFQLASFVAGIILALNNRHLVSFNFNERFNVAMCIAWIVQAVAYYLVSWSRAQPSESAKNFDTSSVVPK